MSASIRQLPVKSLGWTAKVLVSAFLTWTTLNYFIQPQQVIYTIRQLGEVVRRKARMKVYAVQSLRENRSRSGMTKAHSAAQSLRENRFLLNDKSS